MANWWKAGEPPPRRSSSDGACVLRLRSLIEHLGDAVTLVGSDGTIRYRNPTSIQLSGYADTEMLGRSIYDFVHPDDRADIELGRASILQEEHRKLCGRTRFRHKDGSWRVIAWSARNALSVPGVGGIILNSRDETEAVQREEQMCQTEKMEAVGRLAGGIAHHFNNLVGAIFGFVDLLLHDLPSGSMQWQFASRIKGASERMRDIVTQIVAFVHPAADAPQPVDLVRLARETTALMRRSLPPGTQISLASPPEPVIVRANGWQMSQLLLNVCNNARDALGDGPGRMTVMIARGEAGEGDDRASRPEEVKTRLMVGERDRRRAYALIRVTDAGRGMDEATLARIFDPFFTTKPVGQGTGLGLSVVHGLVLAYGGACVVRSTPGAGTEVSIYLPLGD